MSDQKKVEPTFEGEDFKSVVRALFEQQCAQLRKAFADANVEFENKFRAATAACHASDEDVLGVLDDISDIPVNLPYVDAAFDEFYWNAYDRLKTILPSDVEQQKIEERERKEEHEDEDEDEDE